jgi:hypothetical protein
MYIIKALSNWFNNTMFNFNISIALHDLQNFDAVMSEADVNTNTFFLSHHKENSFIHQ